jgi:hypothetical protein
MKPRRLRALGGIRTLPLGLVAILIGVCLIAYSMTSGLRPEGTTQSTSPGTAVNPQTTLSSFWDSWGSSAFTHSTGSDCDWEGSQPTWATTTPSEISVNAALNPNPVNGGCNPMWMLGEAWAGWHVCGTSCDNFAPSQTRFYNVTATWSVEITVSVYAYCGSASSGAGLSDYADVNITPYMAIWNSNLDENYPLINTYFPEIQVSTLDLACSSDAVNFDKTWGQTVTMTSMAWLSSSYTYQPRAAFEGQTWVVSTDSDYAFGQFGITGNLTSMSIS